MLTKSNFINFKACRNEFWLDHHYPGPARDLTLEENFRRETGYEVERLARTLQSFEPREGLSVEFGKVFQTDQLYAKADILVTDTSTGEIEIFEVKSGTSAKDEDRIDLAFQCFVAGESGFVVRRASLVFLNNQYLFDGELDIDQLFHVSNETANLQSLTVAMRDEVETAIALLGGSEPTVALTDYCGNKLECRAIRRAFPDIPEYNISHLFKAGSKKLNSLLSQSILRLADIPRDFKLTEREALIVEVERSGEPMVDREAIQARLSNLAYPLRFLDYESCNLAVPKFVGTRPYQQMVFQYSLHTIEGPGAELQHSSHLSRNDGRHPTEEIVERLHDDLNGHIGTVIVWNETFEKERNKEMALMFPQYRQFLSEVNNNVYDLLKLFRKQLFMHPAFYGKYSIKNVLPILTDLTYDGMEIAGGMTASIKWFHAATRRGTADERKKIFNDLEAYCKRDTLAMVRIYEHLIAL